MIVGLHGNQVDGVDKIGRKLNELQQASRDFGEPRVPETNEVIDYVFRLERRKLLVFTIAPSERLHHMTDDATYLRVGDEKRKLSDRNRRAAVRQVREHLDSFFGRRR